MVAPGVKPFPFLRQYGLIDRSHNSMAKKGMMTIATNIEFFNFCPTLRPTNGYRGDPPTRV